MSSSSRRAIAIACFVAAAALGVAAPRCARAEGPSAADKATARDAFFAGLELRAKGDHRGALAKFEAAYALVPSPITALEVGRSLVDLGRLVEGSERLIEAAQMPAKPNESADAKQARVDARKLEDALAPRIPRLTLVVTGAPGGAAVKVEVDGRAIPSGALGAPRDLDPGEHRVVATAEGAPAVHAEVTLREGETRALTLSFTSPPSSRAGDRETRAARRDVPVWAYVGFGGAGVFAIVGGVTGLVARSRASTIEGLCTADFRCPSSASRDVDAYDRLRVATASSFALAGVSAVVGVVGLFAGGAAEPAKARAAVAPWIGLGFAGVQGRF